MTYKEYLMQKVVANLTAYNIVELLGDFVPKIGYDEGTREDVLRLDITELPIERIEGWLNEHAIDYEFWEVYFDDVDGLVKEFDNVDDSDLMMAWNQYCEDNNYDANRVQAIEDLDYEMEHMTPLEIIRCASDVNLSTDEYFCWNEVFGEVVSSAYWQDLIDIRELAEYMIENQDSLGIDEVTVEWFK